MLVAELLLCCSVMTAAFVLTTGAMITLDVNTKKVKSPRIAHLLSQLIVTTLVVMHFLDVIMELFNVTFLLEMATVVLLDAILTGTQLQLILTINHFANVKIQPVLAMNMISVVSPLESLLV
jgi:hypothetical protein